jgi:hypothetical protein
MIDSKPTITDAIQGQHGTPWTHVVPWSTDSCRAMVNSNLWGNGSTTATSGAMAARIAMATTAMGPRSHMIEPIAFNNQPDRSATNQGMQRQRYGTTWLKKAVLLLTFQFNNY